MVEKKIKERINISIDGDKLKVFDKLVGNRSRFFESVIDNYLSSKSEDEFELQMKVKRLEEEILGKEAELHTAKTAFEAIQKFKNNKERLKTKYWKKLIIDFRNHNWNKVSNEVMSQAATTLDEDKKTLDWLLDYVKINYYGTDEWNIILNDWKHVEEKHLPIVKKEVQEHNKRLGVIEQ